MAIVSVVLTSVFQVRGLRVGLGQKAADLKAGGATGSPLMFVHKPRSFQKQEIWCHLTFARKKEEGTAPSPCRRP